MHRVREFWMFIKILSLCHSLASQFSFVDVSCIFHHQWEPMKLEGCASLDEFILGTLTRFSDFHSRNVAFLCQTCTLLKSMPRPQFYRCNISPDLSKQILGWLLETDTADFFRHTFIIWNVKLILLPGPFCSITTYLTLCLNRMWYSCS